MINNIKAFGKFLDQPMLISKLDKAMPKILGTGVALYGAKMAHDTYQASEGKSDEEKKELKKDFVKKMVILSFSTLSAVMAPRIASKITGRKTLDSIQTTKEKNTALIDEFILKNKDSLNKQTIELLDAAKNSVLSFKQIKSLISNLKLSNKGEFINRLIPEPENLKAKDIFSEIGYLSLYGAIPVVGGIASGVAMDKVYGEDVKKTAPDKLNEGLYQYLANIFMCNVGAGAALGILEKLNITSKGARALGMVTGIILTGVIGGSKIANFIAQKVVDPLTKTKTKERKPELVDLGMHTDDIATVAVLSGLKWIEPSLPTLYALSGYKSGIGYRN